MSCTCGRIKVGGRPTASRNWNPDCDDHGVGSEWYNSPEQKAKRAARSEELRDLQRRAREARAAARLIRRMSGAGGDRTRDLTDYESDALTN